MKLAIAILDFEGDLQAGEMLEKVLSWPIDSKKIYYIRVGRAASSPKHEHLEVIQTDQNLGFGGNNNLGLQASLRDSNDWTLLINNDAKIDESNVVALLERAGEMGDSSIFSLAPSLNEKNVSGQKAYVGGRDISQHLNTRIERSQLAIGDQSAHEVFYNIGSVLLLNNKHLESVGLLDEDYFFSGEVADLCYRASQQDLKNICLMDVTSTHFPEDHQRRRTLYKYYSLRNRFLFIRKHGLPKNRMRKFYRFIVKDLIYQALRLNREQIRTDWICLWDSLRDVKGNQNHKFQ